MSQEQRDRVMGRLRAGTADLLVATDVAARGLDVEQLTHVVNYDVPSAPEAYVHRIGRVGRAGREGVAITLAEPREHRLLKNIERLTGQQIAVEKVPTDRRPAQPAHGAHAGPRCGSPSLEGDLDQFRVVVETLADEFDVMEVALAAVKLAHEADGAPDDEEEIPDAAPPSSKGKHAKGDKSKHAKHADKGGGKGDRDGKGRKGGRSGPSGEGMTRLCVAAGRAAGIRPQDLVGAIAGETKLKGKDIGAIEIADRFSLVEVPEAAVDEVLWAMRRTTLKGRKTKVRRERDPRA